MRGMEATVLMTGPRLLADGGSGGLTSQARRLRVRSDKTTGFPNDSEPWRSSLAWFRGVFMKRLLVMLAVSTLLVTLGCGHSYKERIEATLTRMREMQRLDQNLNPAESGRLQELGIFLRVPKSLVAAREPGLNAPAGHYDSLTTYLDLSGGGADAKKKAEAPEAPLRLHVLTRVNRKKAAPKKGEPAEPEPAVPRGVFIEDVRNLLASDLGGGEALTNTLQNDKKRSNDFKRLMFTASNGDLITAYFYKQGDYDVALVWDIPPGQERTPAMTTGSELTMGALATGPRALTAFQGGDVDEAVAAQGAGASDELGTGQAF